jgi:hypothetical protein
LISRSIGALRQLGWNKFAVTENGMCVQINHFKTPITVIYETLKPLVI